MKKRKLEWLATEVMGVTLVMKETNSTTITSEYLPYIYMDDDLTLWQPHKDIAQAMMLLEKFGYIEMERDHSQWFVTITLPNRGGYCGYADDLSTAICEAVLATGYKRSK